MAIPSEVNDLLNFLILLCIYLIPCLIGSSVSFYLKNRTILSGKKKHKTRVKISPIFIYAVIPAVVITFVKIYWGNQLANSSMLFAVAVIAGALGEDITKILTNIKVIFELLKKSSHGTDDDIEPMTAKLIEIAKNLDSIELPDDSTDNKSDDK